VTSWPNADAGCCGRTAGKVRARVRGDTFLCEDVLADAGLTDLDAYACVPGATP
jgi:hypothetical protein